MSLATYPVEDNQTILDILAETLQEIVPVKAIAHADSQVQSRCWPRDNRNNGQLAIVDLSLRERSGMGVLATYRGGQRGQKMVLFTNYARPEMRRRAVERGADQGFDKSVDPDLLLACCTEPNKGLKKPVAVVLANSQCG